MKKNIQIKKLQTELQKEIKQAKQTKQTYNQSIKDLEEHTKNLSQLLNTAVQRNLLDPIEIRRLEKYLQNREYTKLKNNFLEILQNSEREILSDSGDQQIAEEYVCKRCNRKYRLDELVGRIRTYNCPYCNFPVVQKQEIEQ